jgi:hypothetical protein
MRFSVFVLFLGCALAQAETYNDCILENMKGVGSQAGAYLVNKACREKALPYVPAKCQPHFGQLTQEEIDEGNNAEPPSAAVVKAAELASEQRLRDCINSCLNASYLSKHFGDCAP